MHATSCKIQLSSLIPRFCHSCDTISACLTIPATTGFIVSNHVSCSRQCFTSGSITSWLCSALWIIVCLLVHCITRFGEAQLSTKMIISMSDGPFLKRYCKYLSNISCLLWVLPGKWWQLYTTILYFSHRVWSPLMVKSKQSTQSNSRKLKTKFQSTTEFNFTILGLKHSSLNIWYMELGCWETLRGTSRF